MAFRKSVLCRLTVLVLSLCMLTGAVSAAALGEAEMTEEELKEASNKAYDEAMLQGDTDIAFSVVVTLGQHLSDLMVYTYGEIPAAETDSANAAVQLVDEVIRRADHCFRGAEAGTDPEKLAVFDQAAEAWKAAAAQFGGEGERFDAGLPLTDTRVNGPAADAFGQLPVEAQLVYLETAEAVYRTIWQMLRPAVGAKAAEALGVAELGELAGSEKLEEIEEIATDVISFLWDAKSLLDGGVDGERSDERARAEQVGSRLNTLQAEVSVVVNALGIDTVSGLPGGEEGENP